MRLTATMFFCFFLALGVFVALGHCQSNIAVGMGRPGDIELAPNDDRVRAPIVPTPAASLPDAPLPQAGCSRGIETDDGMIAYRKIDCATVPQWRTMDFDAPRRAGFFSVGRADAAAPLRTNREIFRSKSFWIEEVLMYGAIYGNIAVTRNERQNPPIPTHWGLYADAYALALPVSALHFVARKYLCQCVGDAAVAYVTAYRGYGMVKGFYE